MNSAPPEGAPRIQMCTGQISEAEDPTVVGRWVWEIHLSQIGKTEKSVLSSVDFGRTYESDAEATLAGKEAARKACDEITKKVFGVESTHYFDLQSNQLRTWENH